MTVTQLRSSVTRILGRITRNQDRIIITRGGRPVAAMVPIEDLRILEALEALEDQYWVKKAEAAMDDPRDSVPFDEVKLRFGL